MKIIQAAEFNSFWKQSATQNDDETESVVKEIIAAVRAEGDAALRRFASRFDKSSPKSSKFLSLWRLRQRKKCAGAIPNCIPRLSFRHRI